MTNREPITSRGLFIPWAAVLVVAGLLCGGAAWATSMQGAISDLQKFEADAALMLRQMREDLIVLRERLGVPRKADD